MGRSRVVVSTSLVVNYFLDRERFPVVALTLVGSVSVTGVILAPIGLGWWTRQWGFSCCIFTPHSCN